VSDSPSHFVPRVIFFDAAGTLFHLPRGVGFHYAEVLARHGIRRDEATLDEAFRAVWPEMPALASTAGARSDDGKGWWRDLVERVLDRCGISETEVDRGPFFEELYAEFVRPAVWTLYPETREVLETLAKRWPLGVITNFDGRFRKIATQLGIAHFFEHIVISSEVGADKPDARIFWRAVELAGVAPPEALHVGDDPVCDWEGAGAAGLRVFALDRPKNSLRNLLEQLEMESANPSSQSSSTQEG
jgi:putative hydrolase of the HAD superfamily